MSTWRDRVTRLPGIRPAWTAKRRSELHREYTERRERYAAMAAERGLRYDEAAVTAAVRSRLATRGHLPRRTRTADVHTFAYVPMIGWHQALMPDLAALGPVTHFDYASRQVKWTDFLEPGRGADLRRRMADEAIAALRRAHAEHPVDWVFVYAGGVDVDVSFLRRVHDDLGLPLVNMCLDDKQSWSGPQHGGQRWGQVDVAPWFDLNWTSARIACEWYLCEGGRPVYMPEGFDPSQYQPMDVPRDIPVSFVGAAYGFRVALVDDLRRFGVDVHVFGDGWGTRSVWGREQVEVFNRSRVNLGMGGIGYSEWLTNVKTRDFEIPGTGGGVYLTSFNPDLALHFHVGREILCHRNREEVVELVRWCLACPDEAEAIARAGRARCLAEHRWAHRYARCCDILEVTEGRLPVGPPEAAR